jgi:hypothetical protein
MEGGRFGATEVIGVGCCFSWIWLCSWTCHVVYNKQEGAEGGLQEGMGWTLESGERVANVQLAEVNYSYRCDGFPNDPCIFSPIRLT